MIKLTFSKTTKLTANSNSVCIMQCEIATNTLPLSYSELFKIANKANIQFEYGVFKFKTTAVARCHVDDAERYDATLGLRIAESKCKKKAYNKAARIVSLIEASILDFSRQMTMDRLDLYSLEDYERAHLNRLTT